MATLRDIRRRIASVRSTQQVTRTMKMVAQARLHRLQSAIIAFRSYSDRFSWIMEEFLVDLVGDEHPLMEARAEGPVALVVMVADRGLCGPFNSSMLRAARGFIREQGGDVRLVVVGKKGAGFFRKQGIELMSAFTDLYSSPTFGRARNVVESVTGPFLDAKVRQVYMLYSRFVTAMRQEPVVRRLLPMGLKTGREETEGEKPSYGRFDYEPSASRMCEALLTGWLDVAVYRALMETACSIFGARMVAMDQATDNASEMIDELTLLYHRTRQNNITTELMDIVGGVTAGS